MIVSVRVVSVLVSFANVQRCSKTVLTTAEYASQTGPDGCGQLAADLLSGLRAQPSRGFKSRHLRPDQAKR